MVICTATLARKLDSSPGIGQPELVVVQSAEIRIR